MFKKCLVLEVSLIAALVVSLPAWAQPDTVCGWIGPTDCNNDTGSIVRSTHCTQGNYSLQFSMFYVGPDSTLGDSVGHADFSKYFGGIELPDSMKIDALKDSLSSEKGCVKMMITHCDTVWISCWWFKEQEWTTYDLHHGDFMGGWIISPETLRIHLPPAHIDTLKFRIIKYGPVEADSQHLYASMWIDNIRFYYTDSETLVDGMGDEIGTEEIIPVYKQKFKVYSNPCLNSTIEISYCLPIPDHILFEIYDITGSKVASFEETKSVGKYKKSWNVRDKNGKKLTSGIYFLRMMTNNSSITKKLILLR